MTTNQLEKKFLKEAARKKRHIAVGIWRPDKEIINSLKKAKKYANLTIVGSKIKGFNCIDTKNDDEASKIIVDLAVSKKVDGFVRAQLKDSFTHHLFVEKTGVNLDLKFVPLFMSKGDYWFAISNPSNYNSITSEAQVSEAERLAEYMQNNLKIKPKIAVMSTRRPSGRVGEFKMLEEIAIKCEKTAEVLRKKGYDVKEYYIEYETAVLEKRNIMVGSSGMVCNTWLKGLAYLGDWKITHVPYLDQGAYYDDCPRNNKNWFWPIVSTVAWINRENKK